MWGWVPAPILVILSDLGAILGSDWANTILKEPFQTEEWLWRNKCFLRERYRVGRKPVSSVVRGTVSSRLVRLEVTADLAETSPLPHTLSVHRTSSFRVTSSWDALSQPGSQTARVHGPLPPTPDHEM